MVKKGRNKVCVRTNSKTKCVKVGDFLFESWGYDQTQNDFCKIKSISPTGKTVKCDMVHSKVVSRNRGYLNVAPTNRRVGCPPVRLYVRKWKEPLFVGTYPFLSNIRRKEDCKAKRKGSFWKYTKPVYETAPGYGH